MYIERDFTKRPVTDFKINVEKHITAEKVAEEVLNSSNILVGWRIVDLVK